jgi:hypothetical protein
MSYLSGFKLAPVGYRHELQKFSTPENLAAVEQLDGEISQHNKITSELDQLISDVSNQVLQSDPVAVKRRISEQPTALGVAALALLERKAAMLPILQADFKPWSAAKNEALKKKRADIEEKLRGIGLESRDRFAGEPVLRVLCADETSDAFWNPYVFAGLQDGAIAREKAQIEGAIRQSMKG